MIDLPEVVEREHYRPPPILTWERIQKLLLRAVVFVGLLLTLHIDLGKVYAIESGEI